ncbi:Phage-related holin [Thermobacillus xylanilyticus]|jgi:toxin secretion/phage lysis holin|nr:Phage-related holin [Thermobacillus xylanilyticus]
MMRKGGIDMTLHLTPGLVLSSAGAVVGSILSFAYGGWSEALTALVVAIGVDYVTGVAAAVKRKQGLSSTIGFRGLTMKGIMLLVILLAHRIDVLLGGGSAVMSGAIYFYLVNELISIAENCGELGIPFPDKLKSLIAVLRDREPPDGKQQ